MNTLALILIPAAIFIAVMAGVLALRGQRVRAPGRPWWSTPVPWILASTAFVLLGLFVFPRLFGFTFIFLPFLLARSFGRRRSENGRRRPEDERY